MRESFVNSLIHGCSTRGGLGAPTERQCRSSGEKAVSATLPSSGCEVRAGPARARQRGQSVPPEGCRCCNKFQEHAAVAHGGFPNRLNYLSSIGLVRAGWYRRGQRRVKLTWVAGGDPQATLSGHIDFSIDAWRDRPIVQCPSPANWGIRSRLLRASGMGASYAMAEQLDMYCPIHPATRLPSWSRKVTGRQCHARTVMSFCTARGGGPWRDRHENVNEL